MANTKDVQPYAKGQIYNESGQMTEAQSIQVEINSNLNIVNTLAKNFAGVSPGPISTTVTVSGAIPAAGWELNPAKYLNKTKASELTVALGGLTNTIMGFYQSYSVSTAVDGSATISFVFVGGETEFEGGII